MERIDEIDAKILNLLQGSGRIKRNAIAEEVGLSVPSVSDRMRKLEERGVITGYQALVDAKRLHLDITAIVRVMIDGSSHYGEFVERVADMDDVLEIHSVTGEGSHILKVRTRNTTSLEALLQEIHSWPWVRNTSTSIVLSTYKETSRINIAPMDLVQFGSEQS